MLAVAPIGSTWPTAFVQQLTRMWSGPHSLSVVFVPAHNASITVPCLLTPAFLKVAAYADLFMFDVAHVPGRAFKDDISAAERLLRTALKAAACPSAMLLAAPWNACARAATGQGLGLNHCTKSGSVGLASAAPALSLLAQFYGTPLVVSASQLATDAVVLLGAWNQTASLMTPWLLPRRTMQHTGAEFREVGLSCRMRGAFLPTSPLAPACLLPFESSS